MYIDKPIQIPVTHNGTGLEFILFITEMDYSSYHPGSGPSYSCGGTPPEPAEAYPTEGYVEMDGDVFSIVDITSEDMDVVMQLTNANEDLFDTLVEENAEKIEEILVEYAENKAYDEQAEAAAERASNRKQSLSILDYEY